MPRFTVTAATNSNPVQITISQALPWSGNVNIFVGGGTGAWAGINNKGGDRPQAMTATRTGPNTFSVPVDSSGFGSFSGQQLVLFFHDSGYSGYGYQGLDWQSTLQTLGLAYQVTGNAAYATKGVELLNYISSLGAAGMVAPEAIDSGFPSRSTVVALALGYDWFYDRLSSSERTMAVQALNVWYDWFKRAAFENNGPAYGNYFGGHIMGFGMAALATEYENARGAEISGFIRTLFDSQVGPAFESGGFAGGFPVEAYTYGTNHFIRLLYYMLAVKTATGEDIFSQTTYVQKIARNLIYNLKPNRWQVTDEGDFAGDYTGVLQPSLPLMLSHLLAGTDEGAWMQFLYRNLASSPHGGQVADPFGQFVFFDRNRPEKDYRQSLATWFHSPGDEHMYWRSSWQDDAVWASMNGGATVWASHQQRAAGHVAMQRGNDYLLVNSGQWKGANGVTGNPQVFDNRGWRTNTLFVNDFGEFLFTGAAYVGGQGYWGTNVVMAKEGRTGLAYMKADLTSAYDLGGRKPASARSVRFFQRSFVALGSGIVVLYDRVEFLKDSYVAKLYFHLNPNGGSPSVSDNTFSSRVGSSALFVKTLLPANPDIDVTTDPISDSDSRPSTYRVEVGNSVPSTKLNALNVLVATSSSGAMLPTERITSTGGTMTGAVIADAGTSRVVLFSAEGGAQSSVTYTASLSQPGVHVLTDLAANASFDVLLNGTVITTTTASSQGLATFQSNGGGQFELRARSGASAPSAPSAPSVRTPGAPANLRVVSSATSATPPANLLPEISTFMATPSTMLTGGRVTLLWQVTGATSVEIDGGVGVVAGVSTAVTVNSTTTYTLTAKNAAGTSTRSVVIAIGQNPSTGPAGRSVAMVTPVSGETFTAPGTLRLVASGRDPLVYNNSPSNGLGGNASRVQFFVDEQMVLEVPGSAAEFWVFKGYATGIAAGSHRVWARAIYTNPALVLDSEPVLITVRPAPTYVRTINLTADLNTAQAAELIGSPTGRVRVNGNGYRIVSGASASAPVTWQSVDFFDLGDRVTTSAPGISVSTGALTLEDCTFENSNVIQFTLSGGSATATIRGNTFRSNSRQPLGQYPDGNGGVTNGSYPALILSGMSSGAKVFQGNNMAAGWVQFQSTRDWLVGGDAPGDGNVLVGARVGIYLDRSSNIQIRRNYSRHIYYGGWSQGSNFELGGDPTVIAEHNIIAGSSWPVRGVGGEFRYNLVLEAGHQWLWVGNSNVSVHHNLFVGGDADVAGILVLYSPTNVRIYNNTFDTLNGQNVTNALTIYNGSVSLTSNLFLNVPKTSVNVGGGSLSANYNAFWNSAGPVYSDRRTPSNDVAADPQLTASIARAIDYDETAVWSRSVGIQTLLANYRAKYAPRDGSAVLSRSDPSGPSNFIGAIGGTTSNASDQFGR